MNFRRYIVSIVIITSVFVGSDASTASSTISSHSWNLKQWNESQTLNWFPIALVNATMNSSVQFNVTNYDPTNLSFPSTGTFSIGNFTLENATNFDISIALTLSILSWTPGVYTHTNWTIHKTEAMSASESGFSQGDLAIQDSIAYTLGSLVRKAIRFEYHQNTSIANQNTTLTYDYDTGVLLHGQSAVYLSNLYIIELQLVDSTLVTASNTTVQVSGFLLPILAPLVLALPNRRRH